MSEWRNIESAPTGEAVLAYFPAQAVKTVRLRGYLGPTDDVPPADDPRWCEEMQHTEGGIYHCIQWDAGEDWELARCDDNSYWPQGDPTHWMPLPAEPS